VQDGDGTGTMACSLEVEVVMDGSVVLGGVLWLLGVACVVIQLRWAASDRRREAEAAARAARGEQDDDGPAPGPDPWDRLPIQKRI
jgi:hypothetical protein